MPARELSSSEISMKSIAIVIAVLFIAHAAQAADFEPLTATQLLQSPERYASKVVRVVGQVDNCVSLTCNLCPVDMTNATFDANKCLGLEFDGFDEGHGGPAG